MRREQVSGIRVSQGFSKHLSHHVGKVISKFYPFYSYLFCDFRDARFFERATRNNSKTSCKTNFIFLCLTHSETLKHSFVLKGCDSPNCACEMAFYQFSVSFTRQGTRVLRQKSIRLPLCVRLSTTKPPGTGYKGMSGHKVYGFNRSGQK